MRHEMQCSDCGGHGQVSDYGAFGLDFEGPKECDTCGGSGLVIKRDAKGRFCK